MSAAIDLSETRQDEIDAMIADPALIGTREEAREIINILDHEIANIETQLEVARMEAAMGPLPDERMQWVKRAAYAGAMRRNERHRLIQRDKEIRGANVVATADAKHAAAKAKHERVQAEVEERRTKRQADALRLQVQSAELAAARTWRKHFVDIAHEVLPPEQFDDLVRQAKGRVQPLDTP